MCYKVIGDLMDYLNNIKELIEKDIVLKKKNRIIENNSTLITYFEIGKLIVEAQGGKARAKYGNGLIKNWSIELTNLYGKGYDYTNLSRMRQLYLVFEKVGAVRQELTWTHYRCILSMNEESRRNYYINICIKQNLSSRQLKEKIKNKEYERLEYKDNIELENYNSNFSIKDMIKNPIIIKTEKYVDNLSEKALKIFILEKIQEFLLELGYGFTYVGSEYKLGKYKCDLLFYNIELMSYVVIELKIRKLKPIDIGQIKFYMNYIDLNMKKDYMNKTIGIILCKENDEIVIKYITDEQLFMSVYKLVEKI